MRLYLLTAISTATFTSTKSFTVNSNTRKSDFSLQGIKVPDVPFTEGDRSIFEGPDGPVIVAKVNGELFATSAICPHLGLPMKKGKINPNGPGGAPEITCNFHNSCFNMKTGKCNKWVSGVLGLENQLIGGIMSKVGGDQKDIKAYSVVTEKDGSIFLN
jgi:nitrite reductase/ring-hydroxylating ferredoxin subunit